MATLIIEHSDRARSGRLGEILRDYGHRLDVVRLHAGDALPPDLDDVDAVVSCGGAASPMDATEWVEPELALLRDAHARQLPVIGICLGSQLLARALGGSVERHPGGGEIGWHEITLSPVGREDPVFAGLPWRHLQLHWHAWQVSELPPGGRVLASSAHTKIQAWAVGLRTYGIQFHPEADRGALARWADDEPQALTDAGVTSAQLDADTEKNYPAFARLAQRLFESMALYVMPVDRRYQGAVKDLHH